MTKLFVGNLPFTATEDSVRALFAPHGTVESLALINDRTFEVNEEGKVRVGRTNLLIRCLAIRGDSVRIRVLGSGEELELRFRQAAP